MDAHEVLVAARNLIDRDGWIQGGGVVEPGGQCASNAIIRSCGGGASRAAHIALCEANGIVLESPRPAVWRWNDAPDRTKSEVLDAFDRAIAATAPPPEDPFPDGVPVPVELLEEEAA